MTDARYELLVAPSARRQLAGSLPEVVACAAFEFIVGPLLDNPRRVGKRLRPPLDDRHSARRGTYRVLYRIDEDARRVTVLGVFARRRVQSVLTHQRMRAAQLGPKSSGRQSQRASERVDERPLSTAR